MLRSYLFSNIYTIYRLAILKRVYIKVIWQISVIYINLGINTI